MNFPTRKNQNVILTKEQQAKIKGGTISSTDSSTSIVVIDIDTV